MVCKVFSKAILNRLKPLLNNQLREDQCGFRLNKGCADQIFNTRILIHRTREFNTSTFFCFVDLCKAYDSVNREALWVGYRKFIISQRSHKNIRILQALHNGTQGVVRCESQLSDVFTIEFGVKQGDVLVPLLFNLYINAVTDIALSKAAKLGVNIEFNTTAPLLYNSRCKFDQKTVVECLMYADDMLLVSNNKNDLRCHLKLLTEELNKFSMKINMRKTNKMSILPELASSMTETNDENEEVKQFQYLDSVLTSNGSLDAEIDARLSKAAKAFGSL